MKMIVMVKNCDISMQCMFCESIPYIENDQYNLLTSVFTWHSLYCSLSLVRFVVGLFLSPAL